MKRIVLVVMTCMALSAGISMAAEDKWQGVDETVVGKFAREHGRGATGSLINTGEGDMQLFAFLMAGVVGGFAAGYCWRALLDGKKRQDEKKQQGNTDH